MDSSQETLPLLLFFAAGGLLLCHRCRYFSLPPSFTSPVTLYQSFVGFVVAIAATFFVGPAFVVFVAQVFFSIPQDTITDDLLGHAVAQMTILFTVSIFLSTYIFTLPLKSVNVIVGGGRPLSVARYLRDGAMSIATWIVSMPVVAFVNGVVLSVLDSYALLPDESQVAVEHLRNAAEDPTALVVMLVTVCLFAPYYEELLFRGLFQTFFRRCCGRFFGVVIASFLFAGAHYNSAQGMANISLLASLFTLSLFIGFLYEKQQSIAAPIFFHMLFNTVNASVIWSQVGFLLH